MANQAPAIQLVKHRLGWSFVMLLGLILVTRQSKRKSPLFEPRPHKGIDITTSGFAFMVGQCMAGSNECKIPCQHLAGNCLCALAYFFF
jgi:EamA domain-containing membrane protein RarD